MATRLANLAGCCKFSVACNYHPVCRRCKGDHRAGVRPARTDLDDLVFTGPGGGIVARGTRTALSRHTAGRQPSLHPMTLAKIAATSRPPLWLRQGSGVLS
jgi:hypothetical protein